MNAHKNSGMPLREKILSVFREVYETQVEGVPVPDLTDATVLLDTGLSSLGFAVLVSRLEDELGYDPFTLSEEAYYPRTFGEFALFYERNAPK